MGEYFAPVVAADLYLQQRAENRFEKDWTPRVKYLKQMRRKTPVEEGGEVF
ncbi:MAG: hypothetical protein ACLU99_13355 [Alphaproteobacteria bacterium]